MFDENFHIFHSQCDASGRLKLDLFQEMILNTACSAAEAGGFGIPTLNRLGKTWVMARFQMHVNQYPTIGTSINVQTWIEQNRMGFSVRNFRILNQTGCIAVARSAWAVIDLKTRESINFAQSDLDALPIPEGGTVELPPMPRPDRKAPTVDALHTISYSDLDQNGHCNSSRYLQMMLDAYGSDQGMFPHDLIVSYSHELFFGEQATVRHTVTEDPFFSIYSPSGNLCVTAHFVM